MRLPIIVASVFLLFSNGSGAAALSPSPAALPTTSTHSSTITRSFITTTTKTTTTTTKPPEAIVTDAPVFDGDVDAQLQHAQEKWHLTTYWSCVTFNGGNVDCGWHEPVLPGGDEIAAAHGRPKAKNAMTAALAFGALAAGALLR